MSRQVFFRDSAGILGAGELGPDGKPFTVSYEAEWNQVFDDGDLGAADKRSWSKGSARGAGAQRQVGRVRRRGTPADPVAMCKHGNRAACCSSCKAWHCACPGSPAHVCAREAA